MAEEIILKIGADTKGAEKDIKKVGDEADKTAKSTKDIGKAAKDSKKGFSILKVGVKALGTAFKAMGIGLIVAAFAALKEALERNQKVMNVVNTVMNTISGVFNAFVEVLVDTYNWITESSERFDGFRKVVGGLLQLAITPLIIAFQSIKLGILQAQLIWEKSWLGSGDTEKIANLENSILQTGEAIKQAAQDAVNAGKDIVNNFGEAITEVGDAYNKVADGVKNIDTKKIYESAKATAELGNQAKISEAKLKGLVEQYDREAELQRQIRDDVSKSFEERIAANEELGRVLDEQSEAMLKLADISIAAAAAELRLNKDNIDAQVAYQEALNERAAIEAQITGFRSEQLVNLVALEKEQAEIQKENAKKLLELQQENTLLLIDDAQKKAMVLLQIERDRELAEIEGLENSEALKAEIFKKYQILKRKQLETTAKIEQDNAIAALKGIQGTLSAAASLTEEGTQKYKNIKTAEALISTFLGVQQAYTSTVGIPIVGPFLAPVNAGLALMAGMAQVNKIKNTEVPKMNRGGIVGGYGSSTSDSVDAKLSKGEAVINARSARMFRGALSSMNVAGGGVAFAGESDGEVGGGVIKTYVLSDEMTSAQDRDSKIKRRSSI